MNQPVLMKICGSSVTRNSHEFFGSPEGGVRRIG